MELKLELGKHGPHLWTRELARDVRVEAFTLLDEIPPGGVLVLDLTGVKVFDYSFANELFGKIMLALPREYPNRFVVVEHLTDYTRENLERALESLNLAMIERDRNELRLIGKFHPADAETFLELAKEGGPVTAAMLRERLGASLNAINERLSKLTDLGLVYRGRGKSTAGREQFVYRVLP